MLIRRSRTRQCRISQTTVLLHPRFLKHLFKKQILGPPPQHVQLNPSTCGSLLVVLKLVCEIEFQEVIKFLTKHQDTFIVEVTSCRSLCACVLNVIIGYIVFKPNIH